MPDTPRLIIKASTGTFDRLAAETVLLRRTAAALAFETPDGSPISKTMAKFAGEAIAYRVVAEALAWPVTPADLVENLQRVGVKRDSAELIAGQFHGEHSLCHEPEMPSDAAAADWLLARVGANPYLDVKGIRLADTPSAPEPAAAAGPPEREPNIVTEGDYLDYPMPLGAVA
jgi:hypothetical protein